jgi:6,7-dimethyl-8-ribityllumazine synthase
MKKILIVNANYYEDISKNLIIGAEKKLKSYKISLKIINVPGVFEVPFTIKKYIKKFDGFLALGCVIKGETPHFDFICKSTFDAIINLTINHNKPIGNGIITSINMDQALKRSAVVKSNYKLKPNKGFEAANALISIFNNEPKNK